MQSDEKKTLAAYRMTISELASNVQERDVGLITSKSLWKSVHCSVVVKKIIWNY